ncbi:MAG TPA: hypothetical protein VID75_05410 [Acidimicrobiales bacterium]|jgi:hypothetical protein
MERGVKVVGGVPDDNHTDETDETSETPGASGTSETPSEGPPPRPAARRPGGAASGPSRRAFRIVAVVAALGLIGTILFGVLYATKSSSGPVQDPAVKSAANQFLTDFFNFTPKTVDSDFSAITAMATGQFSTQANGFFNSTIRKQLETADASSRGQVRYLAVQQEGNPPGTASIYAVVDQTYANNKSTSLGSDVVRLTVDLKQVNGTWKISNVTVLEGATPSSASSGGSGSAGSSVPGQ